MASKNNENTDENVPNKSETVSISTENVKGKEGKGKRKWSNSEIEKLIEEYENLVFGMSSQKTIITSKKLQKPRRNCRYVLRNTKTVA